MRLSNRTKNLLLLVSLAFNFGVCLAFGLQSYQGDERSGRHDRREWRDRDGQRDRERGPRRALAEQLNLTDEQRAQLDASKERMFAAMREQWSTLRAESDALTDLIVGPELDREAIAAQAERVGELRAAIHAGFIGHYLELRELLAPEQMDAFAEMVRDRCGMRGKPFQGSARGEEHWKSRRGKHGQRRPGGGEDSP